MRKRRIEEMIIAFSATALFTMTFVVALTQFSVCDSDYSAHLSISMEQGIIPNSLSGFVEYL